MPLTYSTRSERPVNACLQCNELIPRPKRFCNDEEKIRWLETHHPWHTDWRGAVQLENERRALGSTAESREWKRKLSLSRAF